jgi:SAM-dependent methyltransferase
MTSDESVKAWYATHFAPTDLTSKCFDWSLLDLGAMIQDKDVLNLGCAYPIDEFVLGLYAARWVAVDFTPEVIALCNASFRFPHDRRVHYQEADMRALPFSDGSFDTVLDFSSSDHVRDNRAALVQEAYRVLRPRGYYVRTYANLCYHQHERETTEFGYEVRLAPWEVEAEMQQAGFATARHVYAGARSGIIGVKPDPRG